MLAKSSKYYFISMGFVWCLFTSIYAIDISKWPTPSEILLQFPGVTEEYVQDHEIPMVLFKTGPTLTCSNNKGLECLFMHNEITSGCKIVFFNDEESRKLVADYFPETYLEAYDKLVPKTYKADIFRLAILYLCGGVYGDLTQCYNVDSRQYIHHDFKEIVLVKDPSWHYIPGIFNGFMAAYPRHPLIGFMLENIVKEVLEGVVPSQHLDITGPTACQRHFNVFFGLPKGRALHFGYVREHRGIDNETYRVRVPLELSSEDLLNARDSSLRSCICLKTYPMYNEIFKVRKYYDDYPLDGIYHAKGN